MSNTLRKLCLVMACLGIVLTAAHVVQAANQVVVVFPNGEELQATVTGSSETHDVALLRLERAVTTPPAVLGNSNEMRIGEDVFVVGAPLGESHTLTVGHLSAHRKRAGLLGTSSVEFLQTDASINPGNSGGPMFNMDGEVVGIVSHILTQSGGSVGLGLRKAGWHVSAFDPDPDARSVADERSVADTIVGSLERRLDPAATEYPAPLVEHRRLAGRHAVLGLVEFDHCATRLVGRHSASDAGVAGANLDRPLNHSCQWCADPVHRRAHQPVGQ